jgi:hypothetical protein
MYCVQYAQASIARRFLIKLDEVELNELDPDLLPIKLELDELHALHPDKHPIKLE